MERALEANNSCMVTKWASTVAFRILELGSSRNGHARELGRHEEDAFMNN